MKQIRHFLGAILLGLSIWAQAQTGNYNLKYGGYWDFDRPSFRLIAHPQTGNLFVGNALSGTDTAGAIFEFDKDSVLLQNTYFEGNLADSAFVLGNFTIDKEGNFYSVNNSLIKKFDQNHHYKGVFLSLEGKQETEAYAGNLDLGSDGNLYYNTFTDTIYGLNPKTASQVAKLSIGSGNNVDQFLTIEDMYFDKTQPYFYTVDGLKARVCKHDMQGHFLKCTGKRGGSPGDFSDFPHGVTVGSDGKIFVAYKDLDVNVYDNELNFLYKLPYYTHTCCQLRITDLQPGADGVIYLLDVNIGLIKYTPQFVSGLRDGVQVSELKIYPSPAQGGHFVVDSPEPVAQVNLVGSTGQQELHSGAEIHTKMSGLLLLKVTLASGRELVGKVVVE